MARIAFILVVFTLAAQLIGLHSYRVKESESETLPFIPFEIGFVGSRTDSNNPEPVNPGWTDTNNIAPIREGRLRNCPSMVGPLKNDKYHCTSIFNGYCDRRSGTCFCNDGYSGDACQECNDNYQMIGGLCYPKNECPSGCSNAGACDYLTGKCYCNELRDGEDCSQFICAAKFDVNCVHCDKDKCLECIDGFSISSSSSTSTSTSNLEICQPCTRFDPRCHLCDNVKCLGCTDLLLHSIRRSGRRQNDPILPMDELERQLGKEIPFGSQDVNAFDDAEAYRLVESNSDPLNRSALSCDQGIHNDSSFVCRRVVVTNKVCGYEGRISFTSPVYSVMENQGRIRITLKRSGGGFGVVSVMYSVEDISTGRFVKDVSPTAMYTTSQMITFNTHEVEKSFILPIHNDMQKVVYIKLVRSQCSLCVLHIST